MPLCTMCVIAFSCDLSHLVRWAGSTKHNCFGTKNKVSSQLLEWIFRNADSSFVYYFSIIQFGGDCSMLVYMTGHRQGINIILFSFYFGREIMQLHDRDYTYAQRSAVALIQPTKSTTTTIVHCKESVKLLCWLMMVNRIASYTHSTTHTHVAWIRWIQFLSLSVRLCLHWKTTPLNGRIFKKKLRRFGRLSRRNEFKDAMNYVKSLLSAATILFLLHFTSRESWVPPIDRRPMEHVI